MDINKSIFRMYDIRGIIDKDISPEFSEAMGRAFATLLQKENPGKVLTVSVGRDMRESGIEYEERLIKGLTESGVNVKTVGLVSTPAFYFSVGHLEADGGVMVSASHNPAEYNGYKMTRAQAVPVSGESGIQDLADIIEQETFVQSDQVGTVEAVEGIPEAFVDEQFVFAGDQPIAKMKIVADSGNGMGAQFLDGLFDKIDADVTRMYWEFDGSFPNHEADPFKPENIKYLEEKVKELGADIGIATDGDGDRVFFVDNEGKVVEPAIIGGLLAKRTLQDIPGSTICYDVRPGKITPDMIEENGGKPELTKVGHSLIKEHMLEVGAVLGVESSGHFFYKLPTGNYEASVVAVLHILQELTAHGGSFAELVDSLDKYAHSGEINFVVEDKVQAMEKIKETYADGEILELDGVSITYPDFWFNVRASNTESKLRLNLEAVDEETMKQKRDELISLFDFLK
jgi:phosphomannomutase